MSNGWKLASVLWGVLILMAGGWIRSTSADVDRNTRELAAHEVSVTMATENSKRIGLIERSITGIERDVAHGKEKLDEIGDKLDRLLLRPGSG